MSKNSRGLGLRVSQCDTRVPPFGVLTSLYTSACIHFVWRHGNILPAVAPQNSFWVSGSIRGSSGRPHHAKRKALLTQEALSPHLGMGFDHGCSRQDRLGLPLSSAVHT